MDKVKNTGNSDDILKLENQICFPIYAASRLLTRAYKPYLDKLNITYPQYLILLVLWEHTQLSVKEIGEKLYLDSGTLTPLLKRMEKADLVKRERSHEDERRLLVTITEKGQLLKEEALTIPKSMFCQYSNEDFSLIDLRDELKKLISIFEKGKTIK